MILVSDIRIPFTEDPAHAIDKARKLARLRPAQVQRAQVVRRSLDARRKNDIRFVYAVGLETEEDEALLVSRLQNRQVSLREDPGLAVETGEGILRGRPVVAGFGPAGMFCALLLARYGYRPIVLERGADVTQRVQAVQRFWSGGALDPQANVQFGEGGAGTFSDGKLTTRIHDPRCGFVLRTFADFGAPAEITVAQKPHIGTDLLRGIVKEIREEIIRLGGEVRFRTPLTGLVMSASGVASARTPQGDIETGAVVAALGHSARDSFSMLLQSGAQMAPKAFSVGVRIEHRQSDIDRALYGDAAGHPLLPAGEYQLSHRCGGRGVYTFCMCPGGAVVPAASQAGQAVVNGMSNYARDGENANSALVCGVEPADFGTQPLDGVRFQERLEQQAYTLGGRDARAPAQTAGLFLAGKPGADFGRIAPSYAIGVEPCGFSALFPPFVLQMLHTGLQAFDRKLRGFACPDAVLTGVESRTSSPVRILRDEAFQSNLRGLYPCGEGAGYAGGIMSAAVDGLRVAQCIMRQYRPLA